MDRPVQDVQRKLSRPLSGCHTVILLLICDGALMTNDELNTLLEFGLKYACDKLIRQKVEMNPTFVLVSTTGDREIVETPFRDQFEKMVILRSMRERMRKNGTAGYVFISENWCAPAPQDWTPGEPLLSTHPECFETVIVTACGRDRMQRGRWKICRDGTGAVRQPSTRSWKG
jgi:hypothetical protein